MFVPYHTRTSVTLLAVFLYFNAWCANGVSGELTANDFKCNGEFCNKVICEGLEDCPEGIIVRKGSYCGCCDTCVKFNDEGESCQIERPDSEEVLLRKCKHGLQCVDGICAIDESADSCLIARNFREIKMEQNGFPYARDLWFPDCNEDGSYKAKQQKKRKNICVDESGKRIHGQEEQDLSKKATCECSRQMKNIEKLNPEEFMTKPREHCTHSGDFENLQCIGDICYCADNKTGEIIGRVTRKAFIHLLPCYSAKSGDRQYLKQCETQLIRTRFLGYQFHQKNIFIVGLEYVSCDYDGTFSFKQCDSSGCVCTDDAGIGIKSYHPDKTRPKLLMKCNCARDEHNRETFHSRYPRMKCDEMGNFYHLQCFGDDYCYCVDEDGDVISEQRKNLTENYCILMLRSLTENVDPFEEFSTSVVDTTTDDDYY